MRPSGGRWAVEFERDFEKSFPGLVREVWCESFSPEMNGRATVYYAVWDVLSP